MTGAEAPLVRAKADIRGWTEWGAALSIEVPAGVWMVVVLFMVVVLLLFVLV